MSAKRTEPTARDDAETITVVPPEEPLRGRIVLPVSKSEVHRLLIGATLACAQADAESDRQEIALVAREGATAPFADLAEDIQATIRVLRTLGATITCTPEELVVSDFVPVPEPVVLDCGESGSTLRFLLPVAAALGCTAEFRGTGRLPERPLAEILTVLRAHGVTVEGEALPVRITGALQPGTYRIPATLSSQYLTGLLLALPIVGAGAAVETVGELVSAGYVDMTLAAMEACGITFEEEGRRFALGEQNRYRAPRQLMVGADWSAAANWLVADALGDSVHLLGLDEASYQPDATIRTVFEQFGIRVVEDETVFATEDKLDEAVIDLETVPDIGPILAVLATRAHGQTSFRNADRLRLKECDRLEATADLLRHLGVRMDIVADGFAVYGPRALRGGFTFDARHDHRMVMAAAIAACHADAPITILGAGAVAKSYPHFFDDVQALGGVLA